MLRAALQASPLGQLLASCAGTTTLHLSSHLAAASAATPSVSGPQPHTRQRPQQHYSTETTVAATGTEEQPQPLTPAAEDTQLQAQPQQPQQQPHEPQQPQQPYDEKLSGPIQPTHILLQTLLDPQEQPPTSHELFSRVKQQYAGVFASRRQFKQHLTQLVRLKWVAPKNPDSLAAAAASAAGAGQQSSPAAAAASAGGKKKAKAGPKPAFVYVPTAAGRKVDVCETGSQLQQEARRLADEWTARKLKAYTALLEAGDIPVDANNIRLLGAQKGMALFRAQQQQQARAAAAGREGSV